MQTHLGSRQPFWQSVLLCFSSWFPNPIAYLRNLNIFKIERTQERNVFLLWGLGISKKKKKKKNRKTLLPKENVFLYFSFIVTCGWEHERNTTCFLLLYFLFLYLCFKCCHWVQGPGEGDVNMEIITWIFLRALFCSWFSIYQVMLGVLLKRPHNWGL
jgi:hypothetical protein